MNDFWFSCGHHLTDRLAHLGGGLPPDLQRGPPPHDVVHAARPLPVDRVEHLAPDVGSGRVDRLQPRLRDPRRLDPVQVDEVVPGARLDP